MQVMTYSICLCLIYFTKHNTLQVHSCCKWQNFILFTDEQHSIVCIYHTFSIHSSVDGHLVCFHVLAILNSAAMNIEVCVQHRGLKFTLLQCPCFLLPLLTWGLLSCPSLSCYPLLLYWSPVDVAKQDILQYYDKSQAFNGSISLGCDCCQCFLASSLR